MAKIKCLCRDLSLKRSIIIYIAVFAVLAVILSTATSALCYQGETLIMEAYPVIGEKYYLTNEKGERLGEGTYIYKQENPLSPKDEILTSALEFMPVIFAPVYSTLCIIGAALLFYKHKLKRPLAELKAASEKIANNDLDFSVSYASQDELGQLCQSFEIMRTTLAGNFSRMWRLVEERKQLNAAFAHDLRTPLTVLKGYNEMLQASEDSQIRETALTMARHLSRMEDYVSSMSRLRRLEDTQPEYQVVGCPFLLATLQESAGILCALNNKRFDLENEISIPQLYIDQEFVAQVCNNLIANAVRYAKSRVTLKLVWQEEGLLLSVADDGKGFAPDIMPRALNPYFTEENNRSEHFGIGLYICKLLCENHGGYLRLENTPEGAKVAAFFKCPTV